MGRTFNIFDLGFHISKKVTSLLLLVSLMFGNFQNLMITLSEVGFILIDNIIHGLIKHEITT